jgi:hypothetical protein
MPLVHVHSVSFSSLSRRLFEARGVSSYVFPLPGGAVSHHPASKFPPSFDHAFWIRQRPMEPRRTNIALKIVG